MDPRGPQTLRQIALQELWWSIMSIVLFTLLSTSLWYLGSRAKITEFLWSRYPPAFARFMDCAACTGFWWGFLIACSIGQWAHIDYLGLGLQGPDQDLHGSARLAINSVLVGLCSIVTTPLVAALLSRSFDYIGTVAAPASEPEPEPEKKWTAIE
jgi:hypothetical protein